MTDNRLHFEITGPLLKLVRDYAAECAEVRKRAGEFLKRFNTERFLGSESPLEISGIYWPIKKGEPPEGWRRYRVREYIVPDKRSKSGKNIYRELATLHQRRPTEILDACKIPAWCIIDRIFIRPTVGQIKGRYFLIIGDDEAGRKVKHKGLKPLKKWEFMKLIEERGPLTAVA